MLGADHDPADTVIATPRLCLRRFTDRDLDAVFAVIGDPETMKFYPHRFTRADAEHWIERNLERYRNGECGLLAVVLQSNGLLIGDCGVVKQKVEGESLLEVGYHFRRDHWGHGYATEAARACMDCGFRQLNAPRLVSLIVAENVASRRVAERNGMTLEREARFHDRPHLMYAITRERYGQT